MIDRRNELFLSIISALTLTACLLSSLAYAQEITNVDFKVTGSTVKITFDVTACSGTEDYDVKVSLGLDGKLAAIERGLSGDLEHVACGSSNIIMWDVLSDRSELKGSVYFGVEIVRTHPTVPEESPIVYEPDDDRAAGAVPNGNRDTSYPSGQTVHGAPPRFFQVAPWIALELARAAFLTQAYHNMVLPRRIGPVPYQTRRRR